MIKKDKQLVESNMIEKARRLLEIYGISDYCVNNWVKLSNYNALVGFFTAIDSIAIKNSDYKAHEIFYMATLECIYKM